MAVISGEREGGGRPPTIIFGNKLLAISYVYYVKIRENEKKGKF